MVAAQSGVNRRLKELRILFDPNLVTGMFDAITAAAGLHGCKVWSTRFLGEWHLEACLCRLQSYQDTVYKHSLGVPRSTANLLTFLEVDWQVHDAGSVASYDFCYWNKLVDLVQQGPSLLGNGILPTWSGIGGRGLCVSHVGLMGQRDPCCAAANCSAGASTTSRTAAGRRPAGAMMAASRRRHVLCLQRRL
jgi:hypothetical protein